MEKTELVKLRYPSDEIKDKTKAIYRQILAESGNLKEGNFGRISTEDFRRLFELYDQHFFDGFFLGHCREKLFFRLSRRMTRAGGKTTYAKKAGTYEIALSTTLIFQTFQDVVREVTVNGIVCHDRLEATMRVLEHEIVHLLELVVFGCSSCTESRFRQLSHNIFGHTGTTHRLVTQAERAREKFSLKPGDEAVFEFEGTVRRGLISRITKRATVMVRDPNGPYADAHGDRYVKFYVPIHLLRPVGDGAHEGWKPVGETR